MTSLSRTPNQLLRVSTRVAGVFTEGDIAPTATGVLVNGVARDIPATLVRLDDAGLFPSTTFPGLYGFRFDGSSLAMGDTVEILFRTRAHGRTLDSSVCGRVCSSADLGVDFRVPPPLPGDGGGGDGGGYGNGSNIVFGGNSYTEENRGIPRLLAHNLSVRSGISATLGPPPYLGAGISIAQGSSGYFAGMTLGGMALYPTIDQRENGGSTDLIDAIASQPVGTYDAIVLTSGFRQDVTGVGGIEYEYLPGAGGTGSQYGVILEIKRRVIAEINSRVPSVPVIIRMTHEGWNPNYYTDLSNYERLVRLQVLGARQIESEGIVQSVIPEAYVLKRLQAGASGLVGSGAVDPLPDYVGLLHASSLQPGGRNFGWSHRTQGDTAPFALNRHQNALSALISVWTMGYLLFGVDPRGDTTFNTNAGLPDPWDRLLSSDGRIYCGQPVGLGYDPYNLSINPGGPPDSQLDLPIGAAIQARIQSLIVDACDDYTDGATEYD